MKKIGTFMMVAAVAAFSFASCQKEIANDTSNDTVKMHIHAVSSTVDTKTVVSENQEGYYDINWCAGDQIQVLEFIGDNLSQDVSSVALTADTENATFEVELVAKTGGPFLYETVFPAESYSVSSSGFYRLTIPDQQTFSSNSFDGKSDVLISRTLHVDEQPTELNLEYKRIGSAGRMVLKGITAGETINSVVFSTEEGYIAGYSKFDPTTAGFTETYSASKKSIELTPASTMTATGEDVVWFRLYAITLTDNFKVVVTTDAATYTKEVDLAKANRELSFADGGLSKFNVAFAAENREAKSTTQYIQVTDASTLASGDIIRLGCASKGKAAGAMGGNSYFASADATFSNGVMTSNDAIDIVLGESEGVWTLTTSEGMIGTTGAKTLKIGSGTNTWTISIDKDGHASITSTNTSYGTIKYNSSAPRFLNYASGQTAIEIYKLDDGKQNQSISFDKVEVLAFLGETVDSPSLSGAQTAVTYSSGDESVATVDPTSGEISLVGVGSAVITAEAVAENDYRAAKASYSISVGTAHESLAELVAQGAPTSEGKLVKVGLNNEPIESIYVSKSGDRVGVYVSVGDNDIELYHYGVPEHWLAGGTISGYAIGEWCLFNDSVWEIVLYSWDDLEYSAPAAVAVESVNLDKSGVEVEEGQSTTLVATINPSNATNKNVTWESSNDAIATVVDGLVTGVSAGTATITVTTEDGGKTATCSVTVSAPTKYSITVAEDIDNGTVSADMSEAQAGVTVTLTVTPDSGYVLETLTVATESGTPVTVSEENQFTMPAENVNIDASFKVNGGGQDIIKKYVKVTSSADLSDGTYLIVCEDQNCAFNGALAALDAVSNTVAVDPENGEIAYSADIASAEFTFTATNGAFKGTGGMYFGNASNSNALTSSATALTNTVSFSDGNADIVSAGGAYLRYNATSGQTRFRYYKSSTYSAQKAIQLYKYVEITK